MPSLPHKIEIDAATGKPAAVQAGPDDGYSAHRALLFQDVLRSKTAWITAGIMVLGAVAIGGLALHFGFEWSTVTRFIESLDPVLVIPLMALLPVAGFPIMVVYLVAGARFGPVMGGVVVAGVTAVHLLLTHAVATGFLRGPVGRFVARRHRRLPEIPADEHGSIAVIAVLVPGLPYVVRNYLLALGGVRLRTYFWICLPIYVARSYVTILLGDLSSAPSGSKLAILLGLDVIKIGVCAGVIWHLRIKHRRSALAGRGEQAG